MLLAARTGTAHAAPIAFVTDQYDETSLVYGDGIAPVSVSIRIEPLSSSSTYGRVWIHDDASAPTFTSSQCQDEADGVVSCSIDNLQVTVKGSPQADRFTLLPGTAVAESFMDHFSVEGSDGNDVVDATRAPTGGIAVDTANDAGDDTYLVNDITPDMVDGPGLDTISLAHLPRRLKMDGGGRVGADVLVATRFNDQIEGRFGEIHGGDGDDDISVPPNAATIDAGSGNDTIRDQAAWTKRANQTIIGGAGSDTYLVDDDTHRYTICLASSRTVCDPWDGRPGERDVIGPDVENVMAVGTTAITVIGSPARNSIVGSSGDDVFVGAGPGDSFSGSSGADIVSYELTAMQRHGIRLILGAKSSPIDGTVEGVRGTRWRDRLMGSAKLDALYGLAGNDVIVGGRGTDLLFGGAGNDLVDARDGVGGDRVSCGPGRDRVLADATDRVASDCERRG